MMNTTLKPIVAACSLALATGAPLAVATQNQDAAAKQSQAENIDPETRQEVTQQIDEAARVLSEMQQSPEFNKLLEDAEAVFIIPEYATAALLVGGKGGEGVVLTRDGNSWSNPAFYEIGGLSVGAQAGAEAGNLAMVLMSEKAVDSFKQSNNFSLNANAGYSIVNWSADAQATIGKGQDVVLWSDMSGAMLEASIGASDIMWDEEENQAYYQTSTSPEAVLTGQVENPRENQLQQRLTQAQQSAGQQEGVASTLQDNFSRLDKNGDGQITADELESLEATAAGGEQLRSADDKQIIQRLDKDGDNALSKQELQDGAKGQ
jgi:lipid-binding SYLF domain-containing protein